MVSELGNDVGADFGDVCVQAASGLEIPPVHQCDVVVLTCDHGHINQLRMSGGAKRLRRTCGQSEFNSQLPSLPSDIAAANVCPHAQAAGGTCLQLHSAPMLAMQDVAPSDLTATIDVYHNALIVW